MDVMVCFNFEDKRRNTKQRYRVEGRHKVECAQAALSAALEDVFDEQGEHKNGRERVHDIKNVYIKF